MILAWASPNYSHLELKNLDGVLLFCLVYSVIFTQSFMPSKHRSLKPWPHPWHLVTHLLASPTLSEVRSYKTNQFLTCFLLPSSQYLSQLLKHWELPNWSNYFRTHPSTGPSEHQLNTVSVSYLLFQMPLLSAYLMQGRSTKAFSDTAWHYVIRSLWNLIFFIPLYLS